MSIDMNPADDDLHGECRHEIQRLQSVIAAIRAKLETIVDTSPADAGVVLLSQDGPTHTETIGDDKYTVYDHEYFSPLGDALIEVWKMTEQSDGITTNSVSQSYSAPEWKEPHRLIRDDDGHWYVIPVAREENFREYCRAMQLGVDWAAGHDWEPQMVNGPGAVHFADWEDVL